MIRYTAEFKDVYFISNKIIKRLNEIIVINYLSKYDSKIRN